MKLDLGRIARTLGGLRVEETASCARALTALVGRMPAVDLLPGGAAQVTRAMLTARVVAGRDPAPWPSAVSRQLDPDDPAFLPTLGVHPVLAARDRTLIGLADAERVAWVDPAGWCGVGDGPSVAAWFALDGEACPLGRAPRPGDPGGFTLDQARSDTGVGLRTVVRKGPLTLILVHWPLLVGGRPAWAVHARLDLDPGEPERRVALAFAVRPMTLEGAAPIFRLERDREGLWTADGAPALAVARPGEAVLVGDGATPDPWVGFCGGARDEGPVDRRCPVGQASGAEVWRGSLAPGGRFTAFAVIAPPPGTPAALVRTSGASLWQGANADRLGLLSSGSRFALQAHQPLLEACRDRLMIGAERHGLVAGLGALALARLGFTRRAGDRLSGMMGAVRRTGQLLGAEPEDAAALAWAAAQFVRWTGDLAWAREHTRAWARLLDRLAEDPPQPGGRALFGPDGSLRWTRLWRASALLTSAAVLRDQPGHRAWALTGGAEREALPAWMGAAPWSAAPDRAPDGSAAGVLAAAWLGLVRADDPGVLRTLQHLRERCWYGGGVLLGGGAHVAATAIWAAVAGRADPQLDPVGLVAGLASPTGALPTARHLARGALGDGDDGLSAALFALLALDRVWAQRDRLVVLPGVAEAVDLPTPFGRIDLRRGADGAPQLVGRWRGAAPPVQLQA